MAKSLDPAEQAEARLRANSYLALRMLSCRYRDGILTLYGCVPSYYLLQLALETVRGIDGVALIVNEVEVCTRL